MYRAKAEPELSHLLEAQRKAILYEIDELRCVIEHGIAGDPPIRLIEHIDDHEIKSPLLELRGQAVGFTEVEVPRHVKVHRKMLLHCHGCCSFHLKPGDSLP